jgi:DNA-binding NarL/FixJ family response regulator
MADIRVMLVDDHAVVRIGYRQLLEGSPGITVVAEAASAEEALRICEEHHPDVVVLDLSMPGMAGMEAIRRLRARDARLRILVCSIYDDSIFVAQALKAGAHGYATKSGPPEELLSGVREVAAGRRFLGAGLAASPGPQKFAGSEFSRKPQRGEAQGRAEQKVEGGAADPFADLSTREFEIVCLLVEGISTAEISGRLCLSSKTVANYITQIKEKLGVENTVALARLAIRCGVSKP